MTTIWFIFAIVLLILEVVMGLTIVLLFSSIAAFFVGVLLYTDIGSQNDFISQFTVFFMLTAFLTFAFWHPLKKLTTKKRRDIHDQPLHNIVGQEVIVEGKELTLGEVGQVRWSGTIVRAMLKEDSSKQSYEAGTVMEVIDVKGNVFIVKEK